MNAATRWSSKLIRRISFAFDAVQQRRFGVWEYSEDPRCLYRVGRFASPSDRILTDGTAIRKDDPCIAIHYWNEHVPMMGNAGADMRWATQAIEQIEVTLTTLAQYLERPEFDGVVAIRGETSIGRIDVKRLQRFYTRLGFDFELIRPGSFGQKLAYAFEAFYVWILIYAINPDTLRGRPFYKAVRLELWMSRSKLRDRYLRAAPPQA